MTDRAVIDYDSGVITELQAGDRIIRKSSIETYNSLFSSGRSFIKVDTNEVLYLIKELNTNERSLLFVLQCYVSYENGLIKHPNGKDISYSDIVEITEWSKTTTSQTINSLIEKNIVHRGKNGRNVQYFLNPWVANKGQKVSPELKEMFNNYRIRSKRGITWEEFDKG